MDAQVEKPPAPVLASLLAAELDPLFWRPARLGYDSAWTAHVPFAHWIVGAARPRMLVELGTHNGVSYSAFCEAVIRARLDTRCFAIDTWEGDEHAGRYGEDVFQDLHGFHEQHYGGFSELLRCTFDAALEYIPDGAIDLLHIDGLHSYEAVRHDFDSWLPKLSDRAVVMFHDCNVRERGFGVWRLFDELRARYPAFEFLHEHGLGVLAVGHDVPADVAGLCALRDPAVINAVRERFSQLGERWRFEVHVRLLKEQLHAHNLRQASLEAERDAVRRAAEDGARLRARSAQRAGEARRAAAVAYQDAERLSAELAAMRLDADAGRVAVTEAARLRLDVDRLRPIAEDAERLRGECARVAAERDQWVAAQHDAATERDEVRDWAAAHVDRLLAETSRLTTERDTLAGDRSRLLSSVSWRLTAPVRVATRATPRKLRRAVVNAARLGWWTVTLRLPSRLRLRAERQRALRTLAASPLFDPGWYCARYADVVAAGENPLVHYLLRGGGERRNPSAAFDAVWYVARYPDVAASNPLLHYLQFGAAEGREIRPVATERLLPPVLSQSPPPMLAPPALFPPASAEPGPASAVLRVVFVAGEPDTPGAVYRVTRMARAAERGGAQTECLTLAEAAARRDVILAADIVVIWRAAWNGEVIAVVEAARQGGAQLVFDVDDLMVDPDLATIETIDGIRSQGIPEDAVRDHYGRVRDTMAHAQFCIATTDELARYMRRHAKPTFVVPNGFDGETLRVSRRALRARRQSADDGLLRIGYAVGSRTHQRDFAQAAGAVARILRERPECRLVLFASHIDFSPLLDVDEFPALAGLEGQIEWRQIVPLARLPEELARFDVNLVPLEVGNPFCEAKSELKHFEAALVEACTIASPTGPFRRAIAHGRTGFLAATPDDWYLALRALLDDAALRRRVGHAAYLAALWTFGPERRAELMASVLTQIGGGAPAARAFALDVHRALAPRPVPDIPASEMMFEADALGDADVTVIVPLYNYARHIEEALESVRAQSLALLDLVVVDDNSTDDSLAVALAWAKRHAARFNRVTVLRNAANSGLGPTRNVGFGHAETPYVLPLDADNRLLPACCETLLRAARDSGAAFTYPVIRAFGDASDLMGVFPYAPARLIGVPYIDAMALVSLAAWAGVGGYCDTRLGWEDYEFWCRMAEAGLNGHQVAHTPLAQYRVHRGSMLQAITEVGENKTRMMAEMTRRHPWLSLVDARPTTRVPPVAQADMAALDALLPLLRCPETGQTLLLDAEGGHVRTPDGARSWPVVDGRPVLFPGMASPRVMPVDHVSNTLPESALALMRDADGPVLNLSAGGTATRLPHVIEAEAAIFRNTGVVADAHHLPFADCAFAAVVVLNAFEHYRDPTRVASEIFRVLRPGGRVLVHTAFLQPLHEAPHHFYNCTRYGLEAWFAAFVTERLRVSDNFGPAHALSWLAHDARAALDRDISPDAAAAFGATPVGHLADLWTDPAARGGDPQWADLQRLPQSAQEAIAAGFEYIGRRPDDAVG